MKALIAVLILFTGLSSACAQPAKESDSAVQTLQEGPPTVELKLDKPVAGEISNDIGMQNLIDLAKQDLAERSGIAAEEITVLEARYVTWRDASAGCPLPDFQYAQVLSHGSKIRLLIEKIMYHYHSGGNRPPFLCKQPSNIDPLPYAPGDA